MIPTVRSLTVFGAAAAASLVVGCTPGPSSPPAHSLGPASVYVDPDNNIGSTPRPLLDIAAGRSLQPPARRAARPQLPQSRSDPAAGTHRPTDTDTLLDPGMFSPTATP